MKITKKEVKDTLFRLMICIIANVLISFVTIWFLEPAHLYAGGATGIAQIIHRIILKNNGNFNLGILIFIINIPIILLGFRFVSKKFALYSLLAIGIQSLLTGLIHYSPFTALAEDVAVLSKTGDIVYTTNYGGVLTLAIFGGLMAGLASGLALRYGTSTGGIDVVGQALALHKNVSIGSFTMILNIAIAVIGGGFLEGSWIIVLFTCVRMILNSLVVDKIHTSYTYTGLHIFSSQSVEIGKSIMTNLKRGCTFFQVVGAYSAETRIELFCVVSTYEVEKALKIVDAFDSKAFITMTPVKRVRGNFRKKSIV